MTALVSQRPRAWSFDVEASAKADRRAPFRYLLPLTAASTVLVIGANRDAALGVAPFCRVLVAVSAGDGGDLTALAQAAHTEGDRNVCCVRAGIEALPFTRQAFDCILLQECPPETLLPALHSLLKPGGAVCISCRRLPRLPFAAAGFHRILRFGSAPSRSDGAEYLSLDGTAGVGFYFGNVTQPSTVQEKLKTAVKARIARAGLARYLFGAFLVIAERKPEQC